MLKLNRSNIIVSIAILSAGVAVVLFARGRSGRADNGPDTLVLQGDPALIKRRGSTFPLFARIPARDYEQMHGGRDYGSHLGYMNRGAWAAYRVDFGAGATGMAVKSGVPAGRTDCRIQVRLDSTDGPIIGDIRLQPTGGDGLHVSLWQETPLKSVGGIHKVYLMSVDGSDMGNLVAVRFVRDPRPATTKVSFDGYDALHGIEDQEQRLGSLDGGEWACFRKLDFGRGASWLTADVGAPAEFAGQRLEFRVDRPDGPILAEVTVESTGGWGAGRPIRVPATPVTGVHDVYVTPVGRSVGSLFSFQFEP